MGETSTLIDYFVSIMTVINPILIAVFSWYTTKSSKKTKAESMAYRKLREEQEKQEKKAVNDSLDSIKSSVKSVNTNIGILQESVDNIKEQHEEMKDKITKLTEMVETSIDFSRRAGDMVIKIHGMDQDDVVQNAISDYREEENKNINNLIHSNLK